MSKLQTPFRYDFVGSFLRPEKLKKARRQFDEGAIDYAALKVVEDECIRELAAKMGTILQEEGYIINPFSRSLFSHHKEGYLGLEHHPAFEHHHYKWSVA